MAVRTIRVAASAPSAGDVLDYAKALIEEYGFNKISDTGVESSPQTGYSLHDSIGEACTRLSRAVAGGGGGTKDWTVYDRSGATHNLRVEATRLVQAHLPDGMDDKSFNDLPSTTVTEVYAALDAARADAGLEVQV